MMVIGQAVDIVNQSGERWWEAELHRLHGELMPGRKRQDLADSERCFRRALEVAGRQSARSLELLRAATSLAWLWADQGERHKAYDLLAPVCGWFAEGFDNADLRDAKALLDELS